MRYESGRAMTLHGAEYADAAYDTRGIYEAAGARGTTVVIPPTRTATVSGRRSRSPTRDLAAWL